MIIKCKVKSITPLTANTHCVILSPRVEIEFKAGQYLMVVMGEKDKRPFSIANSPCRPDGDIELHIGAAEHNAYAIEVVEWMRESLANQTEISIDAPHGDAWLQDDAERDILLIAGGTGFSYVRSILDYCLDCQCQRNIYLYWGAKELYQLYAMNELEQLLTSHSNVTFVPVVECPEDDWFGKTGNVLDAVADDFDSLADVDIYIAGRFEMASQAREQFTHYKSAKRDRMFADAYAFI